MEKRKVFRGSAKRKHTKHTKLDKYYLTTQTQVTKWISRRCTIARRWVFLYHPAAKLCPHTYSPNPKAENDAHTNHSKTKMDKINEVQYLGRKRRHIHYTTTSFHLKMEFASSNSASRSIHSTSPCTDNACADAITSCLDYFFFCYFYIQHHPTHAHMCMYIHTHKTHSKIRNCQTANIDVDGGRSKPLIHAPQLLY